MDSVLRPRIPAPADWLARQIRQIRPDLDPRRRVVEACRAELVWARADWMELALTAEGWHDGCLPHEVRRTGCSRFGAISSRWRIA